MGGAKYAHMTRFTLHLLDAAGVSVISADADDPDSITIKNVPRGHRITAIGASINGHRYGEVRLAYPIATNGGDITITRPENGWLLP